MKCCTSATVFFIGLLTLTHDCYGQSFGAFDFFRGMIDAARLEQVREAWQALPDADRSCLERGLASRNTDVQTLINSGVMPQDYRLKNLRAHCRQFTSAALKQDFPCNMPDENGQTVSTTCNQSFAREEANGRLVLITPKEAEDLQFGGTRVSVTNVETDQGRSQRHDKAEARQRAEQLGAAKAELLEHETSTFPVVRDEAARLRRQVEQQLATASGPDPQRTAEISRDVKALTSLAEFESSRVAAMRQLSEVQAKAEAETSADTGDALKSRLAALRRSSSGLSVEAKPRANPRQLGPSFDCTKAVTALPLLICGDKGLRAIDLEMARAFYVLRHQFSAEAKALEREADELSRRTVATCRLPKSTAAAVAAIKKLAPCIAAAYRHQTQLWTARIARSAPPGAIQEASRALSQHTRLQEYLRNAGVLADDAILDGVYGGVTRRAIVAFADAEGLPGDGFMSDALAARLSQRYESTEQASGSKIDAARLGHIQTLIAQYNDYLADIASAAGEQAARASARQRGAEYRATIQKLLAGPIPSDLRERLKTAVRLTELSASVDPRPSVQKLDAIFEELKPRIDIASEANSSVTSKNNFLFDGDPKDVVFLYNSSPSAGGVARGLDGSLVFDKGRTSVCAVGKQVNDPVAREQFSAKSRSLGIPASAAINTCNGDQLLRADVLTFQRSELPEALDALMIIAPAVDKGRFVSMGVLPAEQIRAAQEAKKIRLAQVESEVNLGASGALTILALNNGSHIICRIIDKETKDLYAFLLRPYEQMLLQELHATEWTEIPSGIYSTADDVFLSAKRGKCGAVYGDAKGLSTFVKALLRDRIEFKYLPVLISPEEAAGASRVLAEKAEKDERERQAALRAKLLSD